MIDCGTHLHVAKRLPDREALSALEAFVTAWATPLGLPLEATEELVGFGSHKFPRLSDVVYHALVADAGTIQLQIPDGWDGGADRLARHAGGTYHPGLNE
eukprot:2948504-Amphidinium_carterae.1